MIETANLLNILSSTDTLQHLNTMLSPSVFACLYMSVVSITAIELGRIMRSPGGILMLISDFMNRRLFGPNTNQTDKRATPKS